MIDDDAGQGVSSKNETLIIEKEFD